MKDYLIVMGLSEDISILILVIIYGVGGIVTIFKLIEYLIKIVKYFKPKKVSIESSTSYSGGFTTPTLKKKDNNNIDGGTA